MSVPSCKGQQNLNQVSFLLSKSQLLDLHVKYEEFVKYPFLIYRPISNEFWKHSS